MRLRPTSRVLLLDPAGRILLMHYKDFHDERWFWATVGGGAEPGEGVVEAALREAEEETGLGDLEAGPVVWYGEVTLKGFDGAPVLLQESYVVMTTGGGALSRAGWTELEKDFVTDMRWWTHAEIAAATETIYPDELPALLPDVLAGRYPPSPIMLPPRSALD
jgi:8-oxo-dGTP pyrophosphatase MutT (NUDIX family)